MLRGPITRAWRTPSQVRAARLGPIVASFSTSHTAAAQAYRTDKEAASTDNEPLRGTVVPRLEIPAFDGSVEALVADVGGDGAVRRLRRGKMSKARIKEVNDAVLAEEAKKQRGIPELAQPAGSSELTGREERLSPAALLGLKRIGMVTLPEPLVDAITAEIYGTSCGEWRVRGADGRRPRLAKVCAPSVPRPPGEAQVQRQCAGQEHDPALDRQGRGVLAWPVCGGVQRAV